MDTLNLSLLIGLLAVGTWYDIRSHRIPNMLIIAGLITGVLTNTILHGFSGAATATAGGLVGLAVLLPFYMMRTLGAGDVKLMAVVGAFLGPTNVLMVILATFLSGGIMALVVAARSGMMPRLLQNIKLMLFGAFVKISAGQTPNMNDLPESVGKLPYAVAITAGTLAYLAWQHIR